MEGKVVHFGECYRPFILRQGSTVGFQCVNDETRYEASDLSHKRQFSCSCALACPLFILL